MPETITNNVISLSNFLKVKIFVDAKKMKTKHIKRIEQNERIEDISCMESEKGKKKERTK